jgi:uncharacterized protein (TIGR04255 family)
MDSMTVPRKITPDYLKDTIVEIRYSSAVSSELMLGTVSNLLSPDGFTYTPDPNIAGNGNGFFVKDKIRIQIPLPENIIIFNCIEDNYIGWDLYVLEIISVIEKLSEAEIIKSFNRTSIRYISEFRNIEIFKNIKGAINVDESGLKLENAILRLTDETDNTKTFVTVTNKGKRVLPQTREIINSSLVDINVFESFNPISDVNILKEKLEQLHRKQKETFFCLISDEFFQTLNPEY